MNKQQLTFQKTFGGVLLGQLSKQKVVVKLEKPKRFGNVGTKNNHTVFIKGLVQKLRQITFIVIKKTFN